MAALAQHQASLKQAVDLGDRFLDKADATFLRRVLLGDVPKVDWKKLNRKATFKMAYKARSFKIQDILKKMHQTFNINLEDATQKEADAQAAFTKSDAENGARGKSKEDAQSELDTLKKEVAADKKFIAQTEADLDTKKKQWKVRSDLRSGELAAISK